MQSAFIIWMCDSTSLKKGEQILFRFQAYEMNMNIINPSSSAFFQKMILNELSKLLLVLFHPVEEAFEHLSQLVNSCHIDCRLHQGDNTHPLRNSQRGF